MKSMTRLQRFMAAINGEPLDHLPVSMWLHFATEHLSSEDTARVHLSYMAAYEWDYLKVMNDYRYPLPAGLNVTSEADLQAFKPLPMSKATFANQLAVLRILRAELGPDVPIVETLFNPLQTLVRGAGLSATQVVFEHPEAGHAMLDAITQTLCDYVTMCKGIGVTGLFYSINGANRADAGGLTVAQFDEFVKPYDLRILQAAAGMVRIAHVHGFNLEFDRAVNYPVEAFSWSHHQTAPSLAEARKLTGAALIGGINENAIAKQSVDEISADIVSAAREAGVRKLLIGPGCTVPSDSPYRLQAAARQAAHQIEV